jgi:hypothetical protein
MSDLWQREGAVVVWGFALNLIWELAQSPLYADYSGGWRYIGWTRLHCALGDVLVLLCSFWATALAYHSRRWPAIRGPDALAVFLAFGLSYTVGSEWYNTTVRGAWAYASAMPQIWGIGLSPILQWIVVPGLLISIIRLSAKGVNRRYSA